VQKVGLKWRAPQQRGTTLTVKTKRWFTALAANRSAPETILSVQIGGVCYTHAATTKTD
jgi:hypothetical protein